VAVGSGRNRETGVGVLVGDAAGVFVGVAAGVFVGVAAGVLVGSGVAGGVGRIGRDTSAHWKAKL
jgi:hypothetical protein